MLRTLGLCALIIVSVPCGAIERLFISDCTIWNENLEIVRVLTGNRCVPLEDGSWIANTQMGIAKFSPAGTREWLYPGQFHHQVEVDGAGSILTLGREIVSVLGIRISAEVVLKISAEGKLLKKFSVSDNILELNRIPDGRKLAGALFWNVQPHQRAHPQYQSFDTELSHFNALYEIPSSQRRTTRGGHYLLTDALLSACFALDENMKLTGWAFHPPTESGSLTPPMIHDCQILTDGTMLYFQNALDEMKDSTYQIQIRKNGVREFNFPNDPSDYIHATARGSVQKLPEGILVSAVSEHGRGVIGIVDSKGKWLKKKDLSALIQEIKVVPFEKFLEKNQLR